MLGHTIPAILRETGVDPADIVGIGTDFTACTVSARQEGRYAALLPAGVQGQPERLREAVEASRGAG